MHKFVIICLSELYLNSDTLSSNDNLNIPGYNMSRAGHPSGNRRGRDCIYYKESLPIKMLNINYLQEYISFDLKLENKRCTTVSLYRLSSQSADEFEKFLNNLNLNVESISQKNLFLTVVIGDFNARLSKWWMDDKTTQECLKIERKLALSIFPFTSNQ